MWGLPGGAPPSRESILDSNEQASYEESGHEEGENVATSNRFETGLIFGDSELIASGTAYLYPILAEVL